MSMMPSQRPVQFQRNRPPSMTTAIPTDTPPTGMSTSTPQPSGVASSPNGTIGGESNGMALGFDDGGDVPNPGGVIPESPDDPGFVGSDPNMATDPNQLMTGVMDTLSQLRAKYGLTDEPFGAAAQQALGGSKPVDQTAVEGFDDGGVPEDQGVMPDQQPPDLPPPPDDSAPNPLKSLWEGAKSAAGAVGGAAKTVGQALSGGPGSAETAEYSALNPQGPTPDVQGYMQGGRGLSIDNLQAAMQRADPDGVMSPKERIMRAITMGADSSGPMSTEDQTSLLHTAMHTANVYRANAGQALAQGHMPQAVENFKNWASYIPDGNNIDFALGPDGSTIIATVKPLSGGESKSYNLNTSQAFQLSIDAQGMPDTMMEVDANRVFDALTKSGGKPIPAQQPQAQAPATGAPVPQAGAPQGLPNTTAAPAAPAGEAGPAGSPGAPGAPGAQGTPPAPTKPQGPPAPGQGTRANPRMPDDAISAGLIKAGFDPEKVKQAAQAVPMGSTRSFGLLPAARARWIQEQENAEATLQNKLEVAKATGQSRVAAAEGRGVQAAAVRGGFNEHVQQLKEQGLNDRNSQNFAAKIATSGGNIYAGLMKSYMAANPGADMSDSHLKHMIQEGAKAAQMSGQDFLKGFAAGLPGMQPLPRAQAPARAPNTVAQPLPQDMKTLQSGQTYHTKNGDKIFYGFDAEGHMSWEP